MYQVAQIEFENCIFSTAPADILFSSSMAKDFSGNGIKTGKGGRNRHNFAEGAHHAQTPYFVSSMVKDV